jgi:hypothetical protein
MVEPLGSAEHYLKNTVITFYNAVVFILLWRLVTSLCFNPFTASVEKYISSLRVSQYLPDCWESCVLSLYLGGNHLMS